MAKSVFLTGATGFIGGSIAIGLVKRGYRVVGLTRSEGKADALKSLGIEPLIGTLEELQKLEEAANQADIVVNAASSDNRNAVEAILKGLDRKGKLFVQNSGSTVVSEKGTGDLVETVYDEAMILKPDFVPAPEKAARVELDRMVLDSSQKKVHSIVVCPCLIYGQGLGLKDESAQVPALVRQALKTGVARYVGSGNNIWSTVHIKDLVELYGMLIENPPAPGTFVFAENGEVSFRTLAEKIKTASKNVSAVDSWTIEEAVQEWGDGMARFALASNSRIRAKAARQLGWKPEYDCVLEDVPRTCSNLETN